MNSEELARIRRVFVREKSSRVVGKKISIPAAEFPEGCVVRQNTFLTQHTFSAQKELEEVFTLFFPNATFKFTTSLANTAVMVINF